MSHCGFTLVEILVVITILAILTALLIPNVRTITKERNAREAARSVASLLAQASQRAVTDGVAGVVLFPNPNILIDSDGNGTLEPDTDFNYGVTRMALLRRVPNYTGDFPGSLAMLASTPSSLPVVISVPMPIEQAALNLISPGDRIALNNSRFDYEIVNVDNTGPRLNLTINLDGSPDPSGLFASSAALPYSIRRSPRVLRSSEINLPGDFIVDLRFSGFNHNDSAGRDSTVFEPAPQVGGVPVVNRPVALLFNSDGGVEVLGQTAPGNVVSYTAESQGPLFLFITEYDVDQGVDASMVNPLQSDSNLWVTASNVTGTTNVGYNDTSSVNQSLGDLTNLYNGTVAQRRVFNGVIAAARSESSIVSAAQ